MKKLMLMIAAGVIAAQFIYWGDKVFADGHDGHGPLVAGSALLAAYKLCTVRYDTEVFEYYVAKYQTETGISNRSTALRSFSLMRDALAERAIAADKVKPFCRDVQAIVNKMNGMDA